MSCQHEDFEAHVDVFRLGSAEGPVSLDDRDDVVPEVSAFAAHVRVRCARCGAMFGFRCRDVGLMPDRPAASPDALEIRVPLISPSELELLGPAAAMRASSGYPSVRVEYPPAGGREPRR